MTFQQASVVHTTETIRIRYFMDLLVAKKWPVMLVGNAGTGKSVMMVDKLQSLNTDDYLLQAVPFNFYTTSAMLQGKVLSRKQPENRLVLPGSDDCTSHWIGVAVVLQLFLRSPWRRNPGETLVLQAQRSLFTS